MEPKEVTTGSMAQPRIVRLLPWGMILSILFLAGVALATPVPSKTTTHQTSAPVQTTTNDLASRVAQLEALCRTAVPLEGQAQKDSQFLAQFYTAEYAAIMARISAWASLQYAFFPILVAACALLAKLDDVRANLRWWAAIGVLLVGYAAYQGTMLDTLQKVLFIERYLRPLASRVVGTDRFWIHECIYRQTQVANIFYWKYWPPIICFFVVVAVAIYIQARYRFGGWDVAFLVGALILSTGILVVTIKGARVEDQIKDACKERFPRPELVLLREGWPTPAAPADREAPLSGR